MISQVLLIKHSLPTLDPLVPARLWRLSAEGQRRCALLADRLVPHYPDVMISSAEPKALETAQLVADRLCLPVEVVAGLHEHNRSNVGWLETEAFEQAVAAYFEQPDTLVFGSETANQSHHRFAAAVDGAIARHPDHTLAFVAHGAVIALYVSRVVGVMPFPLWKQLGLPSFVVLSQPNARIVRVENIEEPLP